MVLLDGDAVHRRVHLGAVLVVDDGQLGLAQHVHHLAAQLRLTPTCPSYPAVTRRHPLR